MTPRAFNDSSLTAIFDTFERRWGEGPPDIDGLLSDVSGERLRDVLVELIKLDLEFRWKLKIPLPSLSRS